MPKALRKAARDEAKRRGLDLDAVVTDLLHAWLTGPADHLRPGPVVAVGPVASGDRVLAS